MRRKTEGGGWEGGKTLLWEGVGWGEWSGEGWGGREGKGGEWRGRGGRVDGMGHTVLEEFFNLCDGLDEGAEFSEGCVGRTCDDGSTVWAAHSECPCLSTHEVCGSGWCGSGR